MRNCFFIMVLIFIIIALLVIVGILIFDKTNLENQIKKTKNEIEKNNIVENLINSNIDIVETSVEEEKISPNCLFIFKTYYRKCEHIKVEKEQISETMVNKTREDLNKIYKDWEIVTFRNDEVLFYKEEDGICDEHYMLKDIDGTVTIFVIDENEEESIKEKTSILTEYLPQEDVAKLKEGIRVNGKEQLNKTLEDYE